MLLVTLPVVYRGWGVNIFDSYFAFLFSYPTLVRKPTPTVMCNQNKSDNKLIVMYIYNINNNKKELVMINRNLEKVGDLICEARSILDEIICDTDWSEKEDQEDILLGMLDNLQAAEHSFDWNKDEWIE